MRCWAELSPSICMSPNFLLPSYERVKGLLQLIPPYDPSSHPSSLIGVMGLRKMR